MLEKLQNYRISLKAHFFHKKMFIPTKIGNKVLGTDIHKKCKNAKIKFAKNLSFFTLAKISLAKISPLKVFSSEFILW